jgi:hypothetical protein
MKKFLSTLAVIALFSVGYAAHAIDPCCGVVANDETTPTPSSAAAPPVLMDTRQRNLELAAKMMTKSATMPASLCQLSPKPPPPKPGGAKMGTISAEAHFMVTAIDATTGVVSVKNVKTGKMSKYKAEPAGIKGLKVGHKVDCTAADDAQ